MEAIVLVDSNWGIGCNNKLLVRIKADMKRFSALTTGHTVVTGRKNILSFPNEKPLDNRRHLVLSRNENFEREGIEVFHDVSSVLQKVKAIEEQGEKVYLIGGASVYEQLLPYCTYVEVTEVDKAFPCVDVYFPKLNEDERWEEVWRSETQEVEAKVPYTYHWVRYKNVNVETY